MLPAILAKHCSSNHLKVMQSEEGYVIGDIWTASNVRFRPSVATALRIHLYLVQPNTCDVSFSQERQPHNDRSSQVAVRSSQRKRNYVRRTCAQSSPRSTKQEKRQTYVLKRERAIKAIKKINWVSSNQNPATPPHIVSFGNSSTSPSPQVLWLKNQLVRLFELSEAPSWLCTLPTRVGTPGPSPGVLALGPPPPRRGLAMRPKGLFAKLG